MFDFFSGENAAEARSCYRFYARRMPLAILLRPHFEFFLEPFSRYVFYKTHSKFSLLLRYSVLRCSPECNAVALNARRPHPDNA
jgi:hypothetical protein